MSELMTTLYIFVLACFIGYWVIWNVTSALHTPLISLTNAVSGVVIVAAISMAGFGEVSPVIKIIGFFAVMLASINIIGGFLITHRMLQMFKIKNR